MPLIRPKNPTIYGTVHNWWQNMGGVHYVAHAVTATGVVALGAVTNGTGGSPANHPDQLFWPAADALPAGVLRIEIDCSLMPCDAGANCCLLQVPVLIRGLGWPNMPLRIFSHRDEGVGDSPLQNKRVFRCSSGTAQQSADTLRAAYASNENWHWVALGDPRVNNAQYSTF